MKRVAVIIVSHDSATVLPHCLDALAAQTLQPAEIIIVDSGSASTRYLEPYGKTGRARVFLKKNCGFGRANNHGYQTLGQGIDYVLFLNPDAFPYPDSLQRAVSFLEQQSDVGCVGARLSGYDIDVGQTTGLLDSTGVFRKWYGCWYDRAQGEAEQGQYRQVEDVPAVCGAFMLCRHQMLDQVALEGGAVFDPDFFLYKEDIELCLRIWKKSWRITYLPQVQAYHCRGWQTRRRISYGQRCIAAGSELILYKKHPSTYLLWALLKYALVRWGRI